MSNTTNNLWSGRFETGIANDMQTFGASLPVDKRLWQQDIAGSKAHAAMLAAQGIIADADATAIIDGLDAIGANIKAGDFVFDIADEDIHMSIEKALSETIGEAGKRLHTARSRNDQVATDTRLYCKAKASQLAKQVKALQQTIIDVASANIDVVMPGYTHMQKAQPILFAHHLLAYFWMLSRDHKRFEAAHDSADVLPLGSAALAGTTFDIDRDMVAAELGFGAVSQNSLDAVSDRDFLVDLTYACTLTIVHLSRLCEELILWSTDEFNFITLSDAYSTGSSIMPQKKNPDFAELVRGKTGRVIGDLVGLLAVLKGLPLAYNKDLQEDKEGCFDAIDTLEMSIAAVQGMLASMTVNAVAMFKAAQGGYMAATDLADYLVGKGLPFRDAHAVVGKLVLACEKEGKTLQDLSTTDLKAASPLFSDDAQSAVDIHQVLARRTTKGGTAPDQVKTQLTAAKLSLGTAD